MLHSCGCVYIENMRSTAADSRGRQKSVTKCNVLSDILSGFWSCRMQISVPYSGLVCVLPFFAKTIWSELIFIALLECGFHWGIYTKYFFFLNDFSIRVLFCFARIRKKEIYIYNIAEQEYSINLVNLTPYDLQTYNVISIDDRAFSK